MPWLKGQFGNILNLDKVRAIDVIEHDDENGESVRFEVACIYGMNEEGESEAASVCDVDDRDVGEEVIDWIIDGIKRGREVMDIRQFFAELEEDLEENSSADYGDEEEEDYGDEDDFEESEKE